MNPYNLMREQMLAEGLQRYFELSRFVPAAQYPRLLKEEEIDSEAYRNAVLDTVMRATEIQEMASEPDAEVMTFDEALERASAELLNSVQLLGLKEALEDAGAPLSPELIATYKLSTDTVDRPERFTFTPREELTEMEGPQWVRSLLQILIPEEFDVVRMAGESMEDMHVRAMCMLRGLIDIISDAKTLGRSGDRCVNLQCPRCGLGTTTDADDREPCLGCGLSREEMTKVH